MTAGGTNCLSKKGKMLKRVNHEVDNRNEPGRCDGISAHCPSISSGGARHNSALRPCNMQCCPTAQAST